jgi:prolyl-tRNA synthetase
MVRMLGSTVAKEGVNGGEAHVSGCGDAVPFRFKILEEIQHLLRTEMAKIQLANRRPSLCGNEPQQQHERVTVALDRM